MEKALLKVLVFSGVCGKSAAKVSDAVISGVFGGASQSAANTFSGAKKRRERPKKAPLKACFGVVL